MQVERDELLANHLRFISDANAEKAEKTTDSKAEAVFSLSGNIIDEVSGEAWVGVEVKVDGSEQRTYTDFDGHFVISILNTGDCKLISSYTSYNKNEIIFRIKSKSNLEKIELQAQK